MISSAGIASGAAASKLFGGWPASSPAGMRAGRVTGRYAAALQLLSIDTIWTASGGFSAAGAPSGLGAGVANGGAIAATYGRELENASHSGSSDANRRHIAQFNTIMAHREAFPPGEFYLHTELGDGASITTRIPPVGEAIRPAAPSKISITVTSIVAKMEAATGGVATASMQAAYAEWS